MIDRFLLAGLSLTLASSVTEASDAARRASIDAMVSAHAKANGVPEELVHRVIVRESKYNPRAVGRGGTMGLMQIKHGTARGLGYKGPASGLLDADTNLTYAVRYLAGAYRVANGNQNRAVAFFARGYYYDAKRRGMTDELKASPGVEISLASATASSAASTASAITSAAAPAAPNPKFVAAPSPYINRDAH